MTENNLKSINLISFKHSEQITTDLISVIIHTGKGMYQKMRIPRRKSDVLDLNVVPGCEHVPSVANESTTHSDIG